MFVCQLHCTKEIIMVFYFYTIIWALSFFVVSYWLRGVVSEHDATEIGLRSVVSVHDTTHLDLRYVAGMHDATHLDLRYVAGVHDTPHSDLRYVAGVHDATQIPKILLRLFFPEVFWFYFIKLRDNPAFHNPPRLKLSSGCACLIGHMIFRLAWDNILIKQDSRFFHKSELNEARICYLILCPDSHSLVNFIGESHPGLAHNILAPANS